MDPRLVTLAILSFTLLAAALYLSLLSLHAEGYSVSYELEFNAADGIEGAINRLFDIPLNASYRNATLRIMNDCGVPVAFSLAGGEAYAEFTVRAGGSLELVLRSLLAYIRAEPVEEKCTVGMLLELEVVEMPYAELALVALLLFIAGTVLMTVTVIYAWIPAKVARGS